MSEPIAQRTLVKSPPELWAEISDVEALARHLGAFGEIRITRLVPETAVSWEGEIARGTVELSASGWGTKVTLRATATAPPAAEVPAEPATPEVPTAAVAAPAAPEVPAAPAAAPSAPAMLATPPTTPRSDHRVEDPSTPAPLDRKPAALPAEEPRWAASVEQKVRDRYVGAAPMSHRSDARDHARGEPRPDPGKPATTDASIASTPTPAAVASPPTTDADDGQPEKARAPRGLLARLKYWFTPPEDAGAKASPAAVPEEATPTTVPEKTASGTPEPATSAASAHTPSVTKPQAATPAAPEPREAAEPPRSQVGDPAERQANAAIEAPPANEHPGLASPEPVSAEPLEPALAATDTTKPAEAHAEAPGAPVDEGTIVGILTGVLDELGSAHHRPFSRG